MKSDEEIYAELQADTLATVAAGILIDMGTTGLIGGYVNGPDGKLIPAWVPDEEGCPRCVLGAHLANRPRLAGGLSDIHEDLAQEYGRTYHWAVGLMDGTVPDLGGPHSPHYDDYMAGFALGQRLLDWVKWGLPDPLALI